MDKSIDKNKDRSDVLRIRVRETSITPSTNLWEAIAKDLDNPNYDIPRAVSKPFYSRRWVRYVASVAAVLLAVLFIGDFAVTEDQHSVAEVSREEIAEVIETVDEPTIPAEPMQSTITEIVVAEQRRVPQNDEPVLLLSNLDTVVVEQNEEVPSSIVEDTTVVKNPSSIQDDNISPFVPITPQREYDIKKNRPSKTSLSLLGSGALLASNSVISHTQSTAYDVLLFPSDGGVSGGPDACNIKHYQPFSVGVRVQHTVFPRFSVVSGLNYSQLISDITYGAESKKQQRIHFVGVPVSLYYEFLKLNNFTLYAGIGGTVEYCIAAMVDGVRVDERDFHFSANAVMGAQYSVNDWLGFYFEPEISHFLTQTDLKSIRNDSPITFTLRLGVSFTF